MTSPALVVLAHGSRDARSADAVRAITDAVEAMHRSGPVQAAFLDHSAPNLTEVVGRLVDAGNQEIVVVPLFLTAAYHATVDSPAAVGSAGSRFPTAAIRLADVIGPDAALLAALDERLMEALVAEGADHPDALVLASAGSSDAAANASMAALARRWGMRHGLPACAAYASTASPTPAEAVRRCHRAGRKRVAVGSLFIAPGTLPDRTRATAHEAGATVVAEPLGTHVQLCKAILDRYRTSASTLGVLV